MLLSLLFPTAHLAICLFCYVLYLPELLRVPSGSLEKTWSLTRFVNRVSLQAGHPFSLFGLLQHYSGALGELLQLCLCLGHLRPLYFLSRVRSGRRCLARTRRAKLDRSFPTQRGAHGGPAKSSPISPRVGLHVHAFLRRADVKT